MQTQMPGEGGGEKSNTSGGPMLSLMLVALALARPGLAHCSCSRLEERGVASSGRNATGRERARAPCLASAQSRTAGRAGPGAGGRLHTGYHRVANLLIAAAIDNLRHLIPFEAFPPYPPSLSPSLPPALPTSPGHRLRSGKGREGKGSIFLVCDSLTAGGGTRPTRPPSPSLRAN